MRDELTSLFRAVSPSVSPDEESPLCSLVVPIYKDGYLAEDFCLELERNVIPKLPGGKCEVIFVNDGSGGESQGQLEALAARFPWVTVVELSRNFGQHVAITCGYRQAMGSYVAMLNVDMQDPPAEIPNLIAEMQRQDADIAIGMRQARQDPFLVKLSSTVFHVVLNFLTKSNVPLNASSLRVMNRRFLQAFLSFGERNPYIPGLEMWLGFRRIYVPIHHQARKQGKSSYTFRSRLRLAYNFVVSFSDYPLKLMTTVGLSSVLLGLLWGGYIVWARLTNPSIQMGFASLLCAIIVFGGLNLAGLGMASLYIGRILAEVQRRPPYVIRSIRCERTVAALAPSIEEAVVSSRLA